MDYKPGVCNIDVEGQRKRRNFGIIAIIIGIAWSIIVFFSLNRWFALLAFLPFWAGALGILQAKNKFCVRNAKVSVFEVKGKLTKVPKSNADKLTMIRIHVRSIMWAIVLTFIATLAQSLK